MTQQYLRSNFVWRTTAGIGIETIAILILICLRQLLLGNMEINEVDLLPLARQYVEPNWIPGDWYLNQPVSYRELFQTLFGRLIVSWGFLASSIAGRLFCYSLMAWGLVLIGRRLGLHPVMLMCAVSMFLLRQNIAAGATLIVPGIESKTVAYALVFLAIALMLRQRYQLMALLLGLATSFHVLVGAYTTLFTLAWLIVRRKSRFPNLRKFGLIALLYFATGIFGVKAVIQQLSTPTPTNPISPSYIYVFLRLPHHLNPLSWSPKWLLIAAFFLVLLIGSSTVLFFNRSSDQLSQQDEARIGLFEFTLISLVPNVIGLIIAPFDTQGSLLQYYLFRIGDVMLPLNAWLLFACAVQQIFSNAKKQQILFLICTLIVSTFVITSFHDFQKNFQSRLTFPNEAQKVDPQWKNMCDWIRNNTPKDAVFVSPPVEFVNFSWLSERPTIAKYKLLAQTKAGILEWYERLRDLSGDLNRVNSLNSFQPQLLTDGYNSLTTAQAKILMARYKASYLVTRIQHRLNLPVVYRNQLYVLYKE
ncbi:DUF6798 domain-containing protein [Nostoc sp. FACHB-110]|uniref:DUF6798 domain-containing protein n=1 Tax=Nostoc sp. FACHB-110 TaxID=2692834 RepID=UPI0016833E13|nr:DUF6798 domain-containing protein [Nostoc sp. FACHB-110]MBD2436799.1 hypothetical protein [Nostoc sp. FACHB-110]